MDRNGKIFIRAALILLALAALNLQPLLRLPGGAVQARQWMLADQRVWNVLRTCTDGAIVLIVHEGSNNPAFVPSPDSPAWVQLGVRKITNPAAPLPPLDGILTVAPSVYNPVELIPLQTWHMSYHPIPLTLDLEGLGASDYTYYDFIKLGWSSGLVPGVDKVIVVGGRLNLPNSFTGMVASVEDCHVSQFSFERSQVAQTIGPDRLPPVSPHLSASLPLYQRNTPSLGKIQINGSDTTVTLSQQDINKGLLTYTSNSPRLESDLLTLTPWNITRASLASNGVETDNDSFTPKISRDGRYVVFMSLASNLPGGDGVHYQAYLRDRDWDGNGVYDEPGGVLTTLISHEQDGAATTNSWGVDISGNGLWSVFHSADGNIVPNDGNNDQDIFVRSNDPANETFVRVSLTSDGKEANGGSYTPAISDTGRYVVFSSDATNLVPGTPTVLRRIYLHDRDTDNNGVFDEPGKTSTTLISQNSQGVPANNYSTFPSISADGRYVVYESAADNLLPPPQTDTNGKVDVFLLDRSTNQTERISLSVDGQQLTSESYIGSGRAISDDGRYVVFHSGATNILPDNGGNGFSQVLLRDRNAGQTRLISYSNNHNFPGDSDSYDPTISGSGRYIAFTSASGNLLLNYVPSCNDAGTITNCSDVYVYDLETHDLLMVTKTVDQLQASGSSFGVALSGDGSFVTFESRAPDLIANDQNGFNDIFAAYVNFTVSFPILAEIHYYLPELMRK